MLLVEKNFNRKRGECLNIIHTLQKGTRYLQNVCGHAKITNDVALSAKVPLLKKSLESLVFTAKAMLAANNSVGAFELGTLKNKDLQGTEIVTQVDDEDIEEEQCEDEEDDEDEELNDEDREEELFLDANDISEEI